MGKTRLIWGGRVHRLHTTVSADAGQPLDAHSISDFYARVFRSGAQLDDVSDSLVTTNLMISQSQSEESQ